MTTPVSHYTAPTLPRVDKMNVRAFASQNALLDRQTNRDTNGVLHVGALPIFRSGTFRDSMGVQHTWEPEHLEQMVFHYNLLKDRGIFPNVPVRDGHPGIFGNGGAVIGYISDIRHDQAAGQIVADVEVTEPDAQGKLERGTFRARSAEIGMYETNDEAVFWPVLMGFAFVDIPAVEGLYSKDSRYTAVTQEDTNVSTPTLAGGAAAAPAPGTEPATAQTPPSGVVLPAGAVATVNPDGSPATPVPDAVGADGGAPVPPNEAAPQTPEQQNPSGAPTPVEGTPAAPATNPPATAPAAPAQHAAPQGAFTFTMGGRPTTDFAAVQARLTALEGFEQETYAAARRDFVTALASGPAPKIAATQVDSLTALALGLSSEQFESFKASYAAAPASSLLAQHGQTTTNPDGQPQQAADEVTILEERIAMHTRAGMSPEAIAKTASAIRLAELRKG